MWWSWCNWSIQCKVCGLHLFFFLKRTPIFFISKELLWLPWDLSIQSVYFQGLHLNMNQALGLTCNLSIQSVQGNVMLGLKTITIFLHVRSWGNIFVSIWKNNPIILVDICYVFRQSMCARSYIVRNSKISIVLNISKSVYSGCVTSHHSVCQILNLCFCTQKYSSDSP